ncbi:MAG: glycosyltransferase family 2 protein [Nitriliruptorales bacterium]|nr:glycosyltransferase family 2 protein [Nitriliruptorales bacterium]
MATSGPLFTIVLTTHNRQELLGQALESVFAQTVADFEVVVVDDASPTPIRLPRDPRMRVFHRPVNVGAAAGRNFGVGVARGRYITFLDDDDVLMPDRLEIALEGLDDADLTVCWIRYLDPPVHADDWTRQLARDASRTLLEGLVPHVGQAAFDRRKALPFDERLRGAEDVEWWIRMSQHVDVTTVPRVGYLFRRHDGPRHRNDRLRRIQERKAVLDRHAEFFRTRPRSAAFQWKRIGLMALQERRPDVARSAFRRSLALHREAAVLWHLLRSLRPTPAARAELPETVELHDSEAVVEPR